MSIFVRSLDDLEDEVDKCRTTAMGFPEVGASHIDVGIFEGVEEAKRFDAMLREYFKGRKEVSVYISTQDGWYISYVKYTLTDKDQSECDDAFLDYLDGVIDDAGPAELEKALRIFEGLLEDLNKEGDDGDS